MGGVDTLARLREIDPNVRAVVCSGYTDSSLMADCVPHGFEAALSKPFRPAELDQAVRKALLVRIVPAQH
jgi:two-component system cell cycle sensor histidine kinase/response regulator CckA